MTWTLPPTDAMRELGPLPADPEDMNEARAEWARVALDAFMQLTGTDLCDAVSDLLCDLRHLCDRDARLQTFDGAVERSALSYDEYARQARVWGASENSRDLGDQFDRQAVDARAMISKLQDCDDA